MLANNSKTGLNPFALQVETDARFIMVIIASFMYVWIMGGILTINLSNDFLAAEVFSQQYGDLTDKVVIITSPGQQFTSSQYSNLLKLEQYASRLFYFGFKVSTEALILPFIIIVITVIYYFIHPYLVQYKHHLIELKREQEPELLDAIYQMANSVGILRYPKILIGGLSTDAQVYGIGKNYSIRLGHYTRLLFYRRKYKLFRAIILHELAHIANKDISRAFISQGIWFSTLVATVTYFMIAFALALTLGTFSAKLMEFLKDALQYFAYLILIRIVIYNLLRVREHYADYRVAAWGYKAEIEDLLKTNRKPMNFVSSFFRFHPTEVERLSVLSDSNKLFNIKIDLVVLSGILAGIMLSSISAVRDTYLGLIIGGASDFILLTIYKLFFLHVGVIVSYFDLIGIFIARNLLSIIEGIVYHGGGFLTAFFVVGIIGIQIERASLSNINEGLGYWRLARKWVARASLMGIGLEIGYALNARSGFLSIQKEHVSSLTFVIFSSLLMFSLFTFLWMSLVRYLTALVLGSFSGKGIPKFRHQLVTFFSIMLLWTFYAPFEDWRLLMIPYTSRWTSTAVTEVSYQSNLGYLNFTLIYCFLVLVLLLVLIFMVAFLIKITRIAFPVVCLHCGQKSNTRDIIIVGKDCNYCGDKLSEWLYL